MVRHGGANANVLGANEFGIERVMYKPGDVELDCRMVGDTAVVNNIAPSGYNQNSSMSEEINGFLDPANAHPERQLPTYVFLPYHSGTRLAAAVPHAYNAVPPNPVANIRDSYGFMQFLTHKPDLEEDLTALGGNLKPSIPQFAAALSQYKKPHWVNKADFITDARQQGLDFFYILGQLMGMALTFSLSDLHSQNMIVHRSPYPRNAANYPPAQSAPKPHLIDLEDGFKWPMDSVGMTGLPNDNITKAWLAELRLGIFDEGTLDVKEWWGAPPPEYEKNQCFVYNAINRKVYHAKPTPGTRRAMCEGFLAVIEALRANSAALVTWTGGLSATIARYVPIPTAEFYQKLYGYTINPVNRRRAIENKTVKGAWNDAGHESDTDVKKVWTKSHPFWAINHTDHSYYDYENFDIPYFVHPLGGSHLLNSRGHAVIPQTVFAWQSLTFGDPNGVPPPDDNPRLVFPSGRVGGPPGNAPIPPQNLQTYFPDTAINMVQGQLNNLAAAQDPAFFVLVLEQLEYLLGMEALGGKSLDGDRAAANDVKWPNIESITLDGTINGVNYRPGGYVYDFDKDRAKAWIIEDRANVEVHFTRTAFLLDRFMEKVRTANPGFTQSRSNLNTLIQHIEAGAAVDQLVTDIRGIPTSRRVKYGDAIQYLWNKHQELQNRAKWKESDFQEFIRRVKANNRWNKIGSSLSGLIRVINNHDTGDNVQAERNRLSVAIRNKYQAALTHLRQTYPDYPAAGDA